MFRTRLHTALLLFVCLLIPIRASAQCCRVEGVVHADTGAPVPDATVSLSSPSIGAPVTTTSAADGKYAFDHVKPGIWIEVRVIAQGRPVAQSFTLVTRAVETLDVVISTGPVVAASADDLKPMGGESGELRGIVHAADGTPVPGARVGIENTPIETTTDGNGRYSLGRIRSLLTVNVNVSASGFESGTTKVSIPNGGIAEADFELATEPASEQQSGLGVFRSDSAQQTLTLLAPQLSGVPSLGPDDLFRALQLLPIALPGDLSDLTIRSSEPGNTRIVLDDISWFTAPRLMGAIGPPLNTAYVNETTLIDTPLGSSAGGELAGQLALSGRPLHQARVSGDGEVSMFGVSGAGSVPLAKLGTISFGGRHALTSSLYTDMLHSFDGPNMHMVRDRVPSVAGAAPLSSVTPTFSDFNGRLDLTPGHGNHITASLFHSQDVGNFSQNISVAPSTDVAAPGLISVPADATAELGDAQTWKGQGGSVGFSRQWSSMFSTSASLSQSRFARERLQSVLTTSVSDGGNLNSLVGLGVDPGTAESNDVRSTNLHADVNVAAGFSHAITAGIDYNTLQTSYIAQTEARVDNFNGPSSSSLMNLLNRQNTAHLFVVFGQDSFRPMSKLTISPGIRLTRDDLTNASYADPRISASYVPAPRMVLKATFSIDHQPSMRMIREDRQRGDTDFWTLADGTNIPVPWAYEYSGEATIQLSEVFVDARVYYRTLSDLTIFAPRLLPGQVPPANNTGFQSGIGTVGGFELAAQNRHGRNSIWAGVTYNKTQYTFFGLEPSPFPASFDQRVQGRVTDNFVVWKGISVTGVMTAATGAPYTNASAGQPVWFANGDVAYQPEYDTTNGARMPAYQRLDISAQIDHRFGAAAFTAGATVFNVYDQANISYYDYELVGASLITQPQTYMRRGVNAFVRVRF